MIKVWTDGACKVHSPNKPGGWAYYIEYVEFENGIMHHQSSGHALNTTNNEMEMMAVYQALQTLVDENQKSAIIITDSKCVIGWLSQGWKCDANPKVKELRDKIKALPIQVVFQWVNGHDKDENNNLVDRLAVRATEGIT